MVSYATQPLWYVHLLNIPTPAPKALDCYSGVQLLLREAEIFLHWFDPWSRLIERIIEPGLSFLLVFLVSLGPDVVNSTIS